MPAAFIDDHQQSCKHFLGRLKITFVAVLSRLPNFLDSRIWLIGAITAQVCCLQQAVVWSSVTITRLKVEHAKRIRKLDSKLPLHAFYFVRTEAWPQNIAMSPCPECLALLIFCFKPLQFFEDLRPHWLSFHRANNTPIGTVRFDFLPPAATPRLLCSETWAVYNPIFAKGEFKNETFFAEPCCRVVLDHHSRCPG